LPWKTLARNAGGSGRQAASNALPRHRTWHADAGTRKLEVVRDAVASLPDESPGTAER
jgi:hypothetical protein